MPNWIVVFGARGQRAVLAKVKIFLDETLAKISGKSDFAGAIRYATSRWTALPRYVDNGRLEMSNNAAERAIRPLALGSSRVLTRAGAAPQFSTR